MVCILKPSLCLSADDEDPWTLLSHRRKALYVDVVNQSRFIFFFTPSSSFIWWYPLLTSPLRLRPRRQLTNQLVKAYL